MFASFKKLFRKDTDEPLATSIPEALATSRNAAPSRLVSATTVANTPAIAVAPAPGNSPDTISLPLKIVFASLPNSLASVVQSQGNGFLVLPSQRIVEELPKGAIKLPFGELRMAAPPGTFIDTTRHDLTLVELPLNQVLPRLHPTFLSRRSNQKIAQVPAEVGNMFGPRGEGISVLNPATPKPTKPAPVPAPALVQLEPSPTIQMPSFEKSAPTPIIVAAPQLRVAAEPTMPTTDERLEIALSALSGNWPAKIKSEIINAGLSSAMVLFPLEKIETALRSGKIIFTWKQICGWIEPKPQNSAEAAEENLELPLSVVAPLFMAKHRPAKVQKKIAIADTPNLFTGRNIAPVSAPREVEVAAPAIKVEPPISMPPPEPVAVPLPKQDLPKQENSLGELFGQPEKQNWLPNEIVKNLASLPGMAGAFIAMQDGLLVAAQLPVNLKADTVAAFLPQIFGRMNQYTKELQLGVLSRLSFEVENVTWQIVKVGAVYLVVLAKSGEGLSMEKINRVASEISRQIQ